MASPIPYLLLPFFPKRPSTVHSSAPSNTLTLLTSTLTASTNWLVLRFLQHALNHAEKTRNTSVLMVSFLRDERFWKREATKVGIDTSRLKPQASYAFLDGMSLCAVKQPQDLPQHNPGQAAPPAQQTRSVFANLDEAVTAEIRQRRATRGENEKEPADVVLIVDGLDFVLAAFGDEEDDMGDGTTEEGPAAVKIVEMIARWRELASTTMLTIAADSPLVSPTPSTATPLSKSHTTLLTLLAHQAHSVMSLRELDTGAARDVSGVVRATKADEDPKGVEYLYFVGADGGVRVWERGGVVM